MHAEVKSENHCTVKATGGGRNAESRILVCDACYAFLKVVIHFATSVCTASEQNAYDVFQHVHRHT